MRRSNGASGFVGNAYLSVYEAETIDALNRAGGIEERAPGLIVFASDGGGISYGFDLKREPTGIVEIHAMDIGFEQPTYCSDTFGGHLDYLSRKE